MLGYYDAYEKCIATNSGAYYYVGSADGAQEVQAANHSYYR